MISIQPYWTDHSSPEGCVISLQLKSHSEPPIGPSIGCQVISAVSSRPLLVGVEETIVLFNLESIIYL